MVQCIEIGRKNAYLLKISYYRPKNYIHTSCHSTTPLMIPSAMCIKVNNWIPISIHCMSMPCARMSRGTIEEVVLGPLAISYYLFINAMQWMLMPKWFQSTWYNFLYDEWYNRRSLRHMQQFKCVWWHNSLL